MAIRREPMKAEQFTQVPNHWIRDPRLSLKALGLLAYLYSHDADYDLAISQIMKQNRDGKTAVRSALRELEERGYVVRRRERQKDGRWLQYDYEIVEFPQVESRAGFPPPVTGGGLSAVDNQPLRRPTENTIKERSSRDEGMDAEQPKSGEGRGTRKGTAKVGEVDGWPLVVLPGEGLNGTRWADRLYERE